MRDDVAVLDDRGVIEIGGGEARALLQRLITNDVDGLAPGQARYAALLTPQGKITVDFFVVADPARADLFHLDAPAGLVADLLRKLTMYRLRAKVAIIDRSGEFGVVATSGPSPADALVTFEDPRAPGLWARSIVPRLRLAEVGGEAGLRAYLRARVRAGVPAGGIDFAYGDTYPHEANLDRLHGVDFKKGCYVGQEVVSRVEHRGTARKRVMGVRYEGEAPRVGSEITAADVSLGTMGSAVEGAGLGLIRLDRAEEVRRAGSIVLAGGIPILLDGPGWA